MNLKMFKESLWAASPPAGLSAALEALWHQGKGDWTAAHDRLQGFDSGAEAWVHAHLHRVEGDLSNAGYWYRRAGKPTESGPLEGEWESIAEALLAEGQSAR